MKDFADKYLSLQTITKMNRLIWFSRRADHKICQSEHIYRVSGLLGELQIESNLFQIAFFFKF